MGICITGSTMLGAVTPICNRCGVHLCWDISEYEYEQYKEYWDNWECKDCNPDVVGSYTRYRESDIR